MDIHDCFSFQHREMALSDVIRKTGLNKTTAKRLVSNGIRLEQVRKQGYVLEQQEAVEGVFGIAAPVRDYSRRVIAALGIAMPLKLNRPKDEMNHLVRWVTKTSDEISHELGYLRI